MIRRLAPGALIGALAGALIGTLVIALIGTLKGSPVVPVAQFTLTYLPAALGAAFNVLLEIEA